MSMHSLYEVVVAMVKLSKRLHFVPGNISHAETPACQLCPAIGDICGVGCIDITYIASRDGVGGCFPDAG